MTRSGISLVVVALLLQAPATRAAQLDKDSCSKLKTEQGQLEQGGTRGSMGKGPDWAKANLAPEKLEQIRRLIELDEQLLFRCGGRPLVILPSDPDAAPREGERKGGKRPAAKAAKKPDAGKKQAVPLKKAAAPPIDQPVKEVPSAQTGPQPEPAPAKDGGDKRAAAPPADQPGKEVAKVVPSATGPQPETASSSDKEAEKKAAAIKAAKARAKKKANDAYRPPGSDWVTNPFGDQAKK
jgi:hypothetical protein